MDSASPLIHGTCWQASVPHKVLAGSFYSPHEPLCKRPCDKAASSPRASDPGGRGHADGTRFFLKPSLRSDILLFLPYALGHTD